jgi:uroporphyrinogen decarboxylase
VRDRFVRALLRQPVDVTPVWFMRQAGRSEPEYRRLRERYAMLELVRTPDLCTEVTLRPVRQLGVDAAILFSDIMVPLAPMGVEFELRDGVGPVVLEPVRSAREIARLRRLEPEEDLPFVRQAIRQIVAELKGVPLIGFAGGPFTLASYLVEGGPSRTYARVKGLMWGRPDLWQDLMARLTEMITVYLRHQVAAGAGAVQVFDSWIGSLSPEDYRRSVMPWHRRLFSALADLRVPLILFGVNTGELLGQMARSGAHALGVDWRVSLKDVSRRLGAQVALQGNLDPAACLLDLEALRPLALEVLRQGQGHPGYVFNLGHGVLPETPRDRLKALVDLVHSEPAAAPRAVRMAGAPPLAP